MCDLQAIGAPSIVHSKVNTQCCILDEDVTDLRLEL
jgi:hypothetical protein